MRLIQPDQVSFSVEGNLSGKMIATVILVPFVENAFKHALKENTQTGIRFSIVVWKKNITFESENTCTGTG